MKTPPPGPFILGCRKHTCAGTRVGPRPFNPHRLVPFIAVLSLSSHSAFAVLDKNTNGLSDFWEKQYNRGQLFTADFDPQADPDSDGWTNAQEATAGTDPFDPNPPDGLVRLAISLFRSELDEPDDYDGLLKPQFINVSWPTLAPESNTPFTPRQISHKAAGLPLAAHLSRHTAGKPATTTR